MLKVENLLVAGIIYTCHGVPSRKFFAACTDDHLNDYNLFSNSYSSLSRCLSNLLKKEALLKKRRIRLKMTCRHFLVVNGFCRYTIGRKKIRMEIGINIGDVFLSL